MTARPSAFRGIRHVAFRVTNLEECEAFYKDVMGMELLYRANENLVYLTCGNDNLSLARVDEASARGSTFDTTASSSKTRKPSMRGTAISPHSMVCLCWMSRMTMRTGRGVSISRIRQAT